MNDHLLPSGTMPAHVCMYVHASTGTCAHEGVRVLQREEQQVALPLQSKHLTRAELLSPGRPSTAGPAGSPVVTRRDPAWEEPGCRTHVQDAEEPRYLLPPGAQYTDTPPARSKASQQAQCAVTISKSTELWSCAGTDSSAPEVPRHFRAAGSSTWRPEALQLPWISVDLR